MPVELNAPVAGAPKPAASGFTLKGWHVLAMLLTFFGSVFAVNGVMITLALKTLPGTVAQSSYEQSQKFNRGLAEIAAQDSKGWQVDVVTGGLKHGARLSVQLHDKSGAPLRGMNVVMAFQRPTDARLDQNLALQELGEGVYGASVPDLMAGQWRLVVEVKRGEMREFRSESRVAVKE